jgi:Leucine-rich repeat (LRR) protein
MQRSAGAAATAALGTLLLGLTIPLSSTHARSQACAKPEETVTIEDAGLKAAIIKQLALTTAEVSCGDIAKLRELTAREAGIASLKGLEKASELRRLDCGRNLIKDLTPLAALSRLTEIVLERNLIADLGPLVKNTRFGAGARLNVSLNCLELSADSGAQTALDTLEKRGVDVGDPSQQKPAAQCGGKVAPHSLVARR